AFTRCSSLRTSGPRNGRSYSTPSSRSRRCPALRRMVDARTSETVALRNGVTLACYPCRPASVRGLRARVAVVDELAFFISTDGRPTDTEMLRALRPTLATTGRASDCSVESLRAEQRALGA